MSRKEMKSIFNNKNIAVSGGLGSIGSEIIRMLLKFDVGSITVIDNRETELAYWSYNNPDERIRFHFCDVRDSKRMLQVLKDVDVLFHAAAMKHVSISELNPFDAVKTNVIGTQNAIDACLQNGVEKAVLISTDKAVNPTNVMGATKLLAERLVSAVKGSQNGRDTHFGIVRFGNVLYSRGSVLEIWDRQLKEGRKITITDPEMTRFFMDVSQCIYLIFETTRYADRGETFILKMPSVRIGDLAKAYLELKGYDDDYLEVINKRVGEKVHEELVFNNESDMLLENDKFLLRPPLYDVDIEKYHVEGFRKATKSSYCSNDADILLSKEQMKSVLSDFMSKKSASPFRGV
ncbi:MAG: polysaccharide biosynthesis protein [Methermicoccaceae archaeon]